MLLVQMCYCSYLFYRYRCKFESGSSTLSLISFIDKNHGVIMSTNITLNFAEMEDVETIIRKNIYLLSN